MSVALSQDPRYYGRRGINSIRMNPPEHTCSVVLLDRKFIASNGPPAPVDARRLARTLNSLDSSPRTFNLSVYHDRLLFHSHSRGPKLPDICFDDVIQLEIIPGRQNILFILSGRQGIGSYYFFRLSDDLVGEKIKDLARRANPESNFSHNDSELPKNYSRTFDDRPPPKENEFNFYRHNRDYSAPPSLSSGSTYTRSSPKRDQQSSYIRWEGHLPNRNRNLGRQPKIRSSQRRQPIIRIYQNPSKHRVKNSRGDSNKNTVVINAKRGGSTKPDRKKRDNFLVLEDDQMHSKPVTRTYHRSTKSTNQFRNNFQRSKPRTAEVNYHRKIPVQQDYDDYDDYESTFDLTNQVKVGRYRYQGNEYKGGNMDGYDWESIDSWDLLDGAPMNHFGDVNFGVPGTVAVHNGDGQYNAEDLSYSSEDSLYLEREQELASSFPYRKTNYLPELRQKLRQVKLS